MLLFRFPVPQKVEMQTQEAPGCRYHCLEWMNESQKEEMEIPAQD